MFARMGRYRLEWLRYDVAAGLSVAAVYAALGRSRQLIANPDAATCAMVAAIVTPLAAGEPQLYTTLAVSLAVFRTLRATVASYESRA